MTLIMSYVMQQTQNLNQKTASHIKSIEPLFELNLSNLLKLNKYIDSLSEKTLESYGNSFSVYNGYGPKKIYFQDLDLEALINDAEINSGLNLGNNPDVKLYHDNGNLKYKFRKGISELNPEQSIEEPKEGLIDVKSIKRNIEWVASSVKTLYEKIIEHQKDYFLSLDTRQLKQLSGYDIAKEMGLHNTTVYRLYKNKSLRLPDGDIMLLSSLFTTPEDIDRYKAYYSMGEILKPTPNVSDEELKTLINQSNGTELARRTVSKYRRNMENYKIDRYIKRLQGESIE